MEPVLHLSESAAKRIAFLLSKEEQPDMRLRVMVEGGGCSGFQYKFDFDTARGEDDIVMEEGGARVVVDAVSLELLKDSTLDYVQELGGAFFTVKNPQATATCGCGNSFAV